MAPFWVEYDGVGIDAVLFLGRRERRNGGIAVAMAAVEIRSIYNSEMKSLINELKQKQLSDVNHLVRSATIMMAGWVVLVFTFFGLF